MSCQGKGKGEIVVGSMSGRNCVASGVGGRALRVGIFNFWEYRVRVLLKTSGSGRVSGIFSKRIINRVFLGIENHDRVFSGTS